MKLIDLTEGKTKMKKGKAPRAERLSQVMAGRKGGGHYNARTDYVRAKEKEKSRKEMTEGHEVDGLPGQDPFELYRDSREHIRSSINHLNRILGSHYDRGPRYDHPDRDTLHRLARAASIIDNAAHTLAAGTPDDKQDPMDV